MHGQHFQYRSIIYGEASGAVFTIIRENEELSQNHWMNRVQRQKY